MMIILIGSPSGDCPLRGVPQTQRPLVQALIVDPTPNPLDLFNNILLRRYDFPVLYNPATEITPMGPCSDLKKSTA